MRGECIFFLVYLHFGTVFRSYGVRYKMDTLADRTLSGGCGGRSRVDVSLKSLVTVAVATPINILIGCVILRPKIFGDAFAAHVIRGIFHS